MTEQNPMINISISVNAVNTVLAGLQELPFKVADPIMKDIINQAQAQLGQTPIDPVSEEEK